MDLNTVSDPGDNLRRALFDGATVNYSIRDLRSVRLPASAARSEGTTPSGPSYESRVVVHRTGELAFPVEIELTLANGDTVTQTWDGRGRDDVITQVALAPVVSAQVDPRDAIALDEDLLDNARSVERPTPLALGERALYLFELMLGGLTP